VREVIQVVGGGAGGAQIILLMVKLCHEQCYCNLLAGHLCVGKGGRGISM